MNYRNLPINNPQFIIYSLCQQFGFAYYNSVQKLVNYLWKHHWRATTVVLGTLLLEPWQAIKSSLAYPYNWKSHFNFYNLNPKRITEKQAKKRPILLIHGNFHNQSAWLELAKKFKELDLGPSYTVNLPSGNITDQDYTIIRDKLKEIKEQYKQYGVEDVIIDIVGHSRGGFLAQKMAWTSKELNGKVYWNRAEDIGKVIKVGATLDQEETSSLKRLDPTFNERVYEITGLHDVITTTPSLRPASHQKIVTTGHLALLYSPLTHQSIINWLLN